MLAIGLLTRGHKKREIKMNESREASEIGNPTDETTSRPKTLRRVMVNYGQFMSSYCRDERLVEPWTAFLNVKSGDIHWVYENDEDAAEIMGSAHDGAQDNADLRAEILRSPDRFVEIPVIEHSERCGMLGEFLSSDWTDDGYAKQRAKEADQRSIRRWVSDVDDDETVDAFRTFQANAIQASAEDFLRDHGIEADWR